MVSNADYANTYLKLVDRKHRRWNADLKIKSMRQSMSLVIVYFGFKDDPARPLNVRHHNIILGPRYEELLRGASMARCFGLEVNIITPADVTTNPR